MKRAALWSRRMVAAVLLVVGIFWIAAKTSQWLFRIRAERLFADIQSLQVSRSSAEDATALINKWSRYGYVLHGCNGDSCRSLLRISLLLPPPFQGDADGGVKNLLPILADFLGFRNESVGFDFTTQHGVVTQKGFGMDVALPVIEWFRREKSYVSDLPVWSSEAARFREFEQSNPAHPYHKVRTIRGSYGLGITFTPEETPAVKASLMHFRFSCLTQLFPCQNLGEILPEGMKLLEEEEK